jgi:hypothetical protein
MNQDKSNDEALPDPPQGTAASAPAKRRSTWLVPLIVLAVIVALGVQMCTPATYRWKEEVRLHDGRLIVVERSRTMSGPREPFRSATVGKWTLAFENPDKPGKKISLDVHGGADPMLLGFVQGIPYVAIQPGRGDARYFYNCPHPPYIFFRYDGEWKRIELMEFPKELSLRNLPNHTDVYETMSSKGGVISSVDIKKLLEIVKRDDSVRIIRPYGDETKYDCNRPGALHAGGSTPPTVAPKEQATDEQKSNPSNGRK